MADNPQDDPAVDPQGGPSNPDEHAKSKLKDRPVAHPDHPVEYPESGHPSDAEK